MKYREILLEQLKHLPHFDKKTIGQLSEQYRVARTTVDTNISRSLKRRELLQLKNGIYTTSDFFEKNREDISYLFYLANILRAPSYVSSWAALQYYDLCAESIHSITSVTQKVTRNYRTHAGNFNYHSISKDLFSGFSLQKNKFSFFIAFPSKALFDLLYFKTKQFRGVQFKDIAGMVEELRIDFDEMDKKERDRFHQLITIFFKARE